MDQLLKLIRSLSLAQRVVIIFTAILTIASLAGFVHWRHEAGFRPLFSAMASEDAAAIVQKLKESGVDYRLADEGASVLVPEGKVNELRLEMAGAGLPRTGRIGFELFDKTNIGITDFTEHVNYRRALEGELERSVKALTEIQEARIHISFPKDSVFLDAREPAKASVLVALRPGAQLSDQNVLAIINLVASAVEGLTPEFVSVVDMRGDLLSRPKRSVADTGDNSDATLEYKRQVEKDLMTKVESTLEPLLGEGRFRVGMSVDCDLTTSEQTDETFDPSRSVMVTSQKSEDLAGAAPSSGVPGTPSNLPRPAVLPTTRGSGMSRRTENNAYETSRTVRQVKTPRGAIKRISASVLLDQESRWEGKGALRKRIMVPLAPERLKAVHDLVSGVIGFDPQRGDQLVIESLPFEQDLDGLVDAAPLTNPAKLSINLLQDKRVLLGGGATALGVVAIVVLLIVRRSKSVALVRRSTAIAESAMALSKGSNSEQLPGAGSELQLPAMTNSVETFRQQLRETVTKDPVIAANVIRNWLEEEAV